MGYWKTFWVLGKTERQGILFLLVCILLSLWLPAWLSPDRRLTDQPNAAMLAVLDSLQAAEEAKNKSTESPSLVSKPPVLQLFDPNTVGKEELLAMGLSPKTADSWLRFRAKGRKFKKAEDIKKLYALRPSDAERLLPYVQIASLEEKNVASPAVNTPKVRSLVDLNSADSLTLLTVPGIGPAFAGRLVKARLRWGGWFDLQQLLEVYGVDSTRLVQWAPHVQLDPAQVVKLPINSADVRALGQHPVLGYAKAKRLVAYREQHGPFKQLNDLAAVYGMDSLSLARIAPYLQW